MSITILPPCRSGNLTNQLKRRLASVLRMEQTLDVDRYGPYRFRAASGVEVFRTQDYGGEALALGAFLFLLDGSDVVWDVGASVGLLAIHSATHAAKVVAFEPDPATARRLKENVRLNQLEHKVDVHALALGDQGGSQVIHSDGLAGNAPSMQSLGRHSGTSAIEVKRIDDLGETVPTPTVIKIDVEGAELAVLRGGVGLLASSQAPRLLFIEVHPEFIKSYGAAASEVYELLAKLGYGVITARPEHNQLHIFAFKHRIGSRP